MTIPHPNIPRRLEEICLKCLQKDVKHRYRRAKDLAAELQRFLDEAPAGEAPNFVPPPPPAIDGLSTVVFPETHAIEGGARSTWWRRFLGRDRTGPSDEDK